VGVAALLQLQHQVGTQAAEQTLTVIQVGPYLRFQLASDTWQQQRFQFTAVGLVQRRIDLLTLVQATATQPGNLIPGRKDLGGGITAVERLEGLQRIVLRFDGLALLAERLGDLAQLFKPIMVTGEIQRPAQAEQRHASEGCGVQRTLTPIDAPYFALVEPGQFGFGKNHAAQQLVDEPRTTTAECRQSAAGQADVASDTGGQRIEAVLQLRCAGQVEA